MQATVLLLDDEATVRESLSRYLGSSGFNVVDAASADEAFECMKSDVFDAFILDVRLPESRSGLEVLHFVRLCDESADRPVFILTGSVLSEDEEEIIRRFGAYVFYKPYGYGEIVGRLQQMTGLARCA